MPGRVIGIARAPDKMAPLEELDHVAVSIDAGLDGDARGRSPGRQVTVLFREDWGDACRDAGVEPLPWLTRRANLYVEGMANPKAVGARVQIGEVILEVADETKPCALMEQSQAGLRLAMKPEWRGGLCCNVIRGGELQLGDEVSILVA